MGLFNKKLPSLSILPAVAYYPLVPVIYLVSLLPFPLLYLFSDFLSATLYYIAGYRKKVILQNLRNSFPEKTDGEIAVICRNFYRHFCDFFLETIKAITISKKDIVKHCTIDPDTVALYAKFAAEKKNVIIAMGHSGNWEWACSSFNLQVPQQLQVIYHPLSNKYFNGLMHKIRTRNGAALIAMKDTYRQMIANSPVLNATAFL